MLGAMLRPLVLAVDFGGTKVEAALIDDRGLLLTGSRHRRPTGAAATSEALEAAVREVVTSAHDALPPDVPLMGNTWYTVGIGAVGTTLTAYFGGVPVAMGTDSDLEEGGIGIGTAEEAIVAFDDVSVTAP